MIRIFLLILFCVTVAYWIGYRVGKSLHDYRPVCFITFGDKAPDSNRQIAEIYWGYPDRPSCNIDSLQFFKSTYNGTDVYFLIERSSIIAQANGQKVYATLNVGRYSNHKNPYYLALLFRHGKRFLLEDSVTDHEDLDVPKNEEPGD